MKSASGTFSYLLIPLEKEWFFFFAYSVCVCVCLFSGFLYGVRACVCVCVCIYMCEPLEFDLSAVEPSGLPEWALAGSALGWPDLRTGRAPESCLRPPARAPGPAPPLRAPALRLRLRLRLPRLSEPRRCLRRPVWALPTRAVERIFVLRSLD